MPVKKTKICYRKTVPTVTKPFIKDMILPLYLDYISVGSTYVLPSKADMVYSDNSIKNVSIIWDKLLDTSVVGTNIYKASYTEDGVAKTSNFTLVTTPSPSTENNETQIGINLGNIGEYYGNRCFVDINLTSRVYWVSYGTSIWENAPMSMDEYGDPNGDCSKVIWEGSYFANGTYKVSFNGSCENFKLENVSGLISNKIYDTNLNKTTLDMTITNTGKTTAGISITGTKKTADSSIGSGISNFKCIRPGYTENDIFTTEFLNVIKKFNVVRFLDWSLGNGNNAINWVDRTLPDSSDQYHVLINEMDSTKKGKTGVAYEYMIALCNITNCDMYINIPVGATDDYIVSLCDLLKNGTTDRKGKVWEGLKSNLKVYVEYGNEIWNAGTAGFYNYGWVKAKSDLARADANHPIMADGNSDQYICLFKYVGWRTCQISNIFRAQFGDSNMHTKIRPLLEGQLGNMIWLKNALVFIDKYMPNPVNYYIYGGGGSAYYGSDVAKYKGGQYVVDHYFDYGMYPSKGFDSASKADNTLLKSYGLKKVAYEGGCSIDHTVTNGTYDDTMKRAINSNEKMVDMMVKCHNNFRENGGDLLVYYYFASSPDWEITSDHFPTATYENKIPMDTPKMRALEKIKYNNIIDKYVKEINASGTDNRLKMTSSNNTVNMSGLFVLDAEPIFGVNFDIPRNGNYRIYACGNIYGVPNDPVAMAKTPTKVYVDGILVGQIDFVVADNGAVEKRISQPTSCITIPLLAGKRFIKIVNDNKPSIYSLRVEEL